jgi:hypothetical protein
LASVLLFEQDKKVQVQDKKNNAMKDLLIGYGSLQDIFLTLQLKVGGAENELSLLKRAIVLRMNNIRSGITNW